MKAYFLAFLIIWFGVGFNVQGQTFKLDSETASGEGPESDVPRPSSYSNVRREPRSSKATARYQGVTVDPSTIPDSSYTEAGVNLPGMNPRDYYTPGPADSSSSSSAATGYRTSNQFANGAQNVGWTGLQGIITLFTQATSIAQRVAPNAGTGAMFYGECPMCVGRPETASDEAAENSSVGTSTATANPLTTHNPDEIKRLVAAEPTKAFEGSGDQERLIDEVIGSLDPFGGLVLRNVDEYTQMCPNYPNLNYNQRKAFMVFMYSEIFKQTSNYNNEVSKVVTSASGVTSTRFGMCQLEYQQVVALYTQTYGTTFQVEEDKFAEFASSTLNNISLCSGLIFNRTENPAAGSTPIQQMFPDVEFAPIKARLSELSLCFKESTN